MECLAKRANGPNSLLEGVGAITRFGLLFGVFGHPVVLIGNLEGDLTTFVIPHVLSGDANFLCLESPMLSIANT